MRFFVTLHAKSICLMTALCMTAAFAQLTSTPAQAQTAEAAASAPVAFVYVSSNPKGSSTNEINGFAAAANGKLTSVSGSPFRDDVTSMASNGKYLYASTRSGIYVAAFAIEAKSRNDEDRMGQAVHRILEEDQTLRFYRDAQTREFRVSCARLFGLPRAATP